MTTFLAWIALAQIVTLNGSDMSHSSEIQPCYYSAEARLYSCPPKDYCYLSAAHLYGPCLPVPKEMR